MSNLPIDARAILEYLNELGYRNISAEQLKEFMKGMQSQSEFTTKNCNGTNNNNINNKNKTAAKHPHSQQAKQYQHEKGKELPENKSLPARESRDIRSKTPAESTAPFRPRVIKSKRPLVNFKFYLDIRDQNLTRRIEEQIKFLGATQEFFINPSVTHFITDKVITDIQQNKTSNNTNNINNQSGYHYNNNDSKSCLESPQNHKNTGKVSSSTTISNIKSKNGTFTKTVQTRADAILSRARQGQTATANNSLPITTTTTNANDKFTRTVSQRKEQESTAAATSSSSSYISWPTEYALRFFRKVQHELKAFLHPEFHLHTKINNNSDITKSISSIGRSGEAIPLKSSFIKIETTKRNCRPYYQLFRKPSEWPKIELDSEDGAFRFTPKKFNTNKSIAVNSVFPETHNIAMTRKSRSSQRGAPLPVVVQALRKTSNATNNNLTSTTPRVKAGNSSCRQAKESSEKQCGVCEICKIEYDTLTIHLKSKAHEYFAKNPHNFIALDTLIQSSADVNKFLNEDDIDIEENSKAELTEEQNDGITDEKAINGDDLEKMEVDEEMPTTTTCLNNVVSAVEDPLLLVDRPSPVLREKSKRSTKGKHSSEKFQFTHATKTPPKKQTSLELENTTIETTTTTTVSKTQKISHTKANLSSPIRKLMPPSNLYKVVETSEVETTPKRGRGNKATGMDSPSIIVKFKKVRQAELLRLNGEAEKFMFPKQNQKQQRASSDLPTDMDRPSISSEQQLLRNKTLSSSSLDSSCGILDDHVNNDLDSSKINISESCDKKGTNKSISQSFQDAPIQPDKQLKKMSVGRKRLNNVNKNNSLNELSPPSAAAAIVAATAKIQLPAATRKSSRTATAIVTAATTSSRLLRAAADAVKKSSSTHMLCRKSIRGAVEDVVESTSPKKSKRLSSNTTTEISAKAASKTTTTLLKEEEENALAESEENKINLTGGRIRQCRLAATAAVVKMEDRMGDSESEFNVTTDNDDDDDDIDNDDEDERKDKSNNDPKTAKVFKKSKKKNKVKIKNNDRKKNKKKIIDKDYKCKLSKKKLCVENNKNSKIKINLSVKYKQNRQHKRKQLKLKKLCQSEQKKMSIKHIKKNTLNRSLPLIQKRSKNFTQMYNFKNSERLQKLNYSFERLPTSDLWYRVFNRQDACEEKYFEYYGSTDYRKLPYELGPIPFNRAGLCNKKCKLCNTDATTTTTTTLATASATTSATDRVAVQNEVELPDGKLETEQHEDEQKVKKDNVTTIPVNPVKSTMPEKLTEKSTYAHKHKKMHLLQRYRQEQEALQQEEFRNRSLKIEDASNSTCIESESWTNATPNLSKENSPERACNSTNNNNSSNSNNEPHKRSRSVSALSTTSSCASSHATTDTTLTATTTGKKVYRNKHLQKVATLSFELPPRKSPREHASTLAFVSGIIKQRQESKPNSDADEACTTSSTPTSTDIIPILNEELKPSALPPQSPPLATIALETISKDEQSSFGHNNKRTTVATPTEEICFATEISENVKRMRRGQNKYDHSPPYVVSNKPRRLGVSKYAKLQQQQQQQSKLTPKRRYTYKKLTATKAKNHLHSKDIGNLCHSTNKYQNNKNDINLPGIRKTGQKKGVLEFELDNVALQALDKAMLYTNVRRLENEIDNFLETSGKDVDLDINTSLAIEITNNDSEDNTQANSMKSLPAIDCFSSDFDLCDLINITNSTTLGVGSVNENFGKSNSLSLYNAIALNTYFRKRKYMKSNRTGWPKMQKKKYAMRHQKLQQDKHSSPNKPENKTSNIENAENSLMTPPNSESDVKLTNMDQINEIIEDDRNNTPHAEATQNDMEIDEDNVTNNASDRLGNEDDNDTMIDLNVVKTEEERDEEEERDSEGSAEEADDEDEFHDAELEDDTADFTANQKNKYSNVEQADITEKEVVSKHMMMDDLNEIVERSEVIEYDETKSVTSVGSEKKRKCPGFNSRLGKALANCFSSTAITNARDIEADDSQEDTISMVASTSTPTSHMLRGLRRTPQLNGSLLSCNSPSEKAGDNSDIFTVSSDGLDTDLDLSNPPLQSQIVEEESFKHRSFNNKTKTKTSKTTNKYNISTKFVSNPAINSCAAEAVTTAAKTLAIAQFLKKEVRVTCRRIRAPFRRFRYRR